MKISYSSLYKLTELPPSTTIEEKVPSLRSLTLPAILVIGLVVCFAVMGSTKGPWRFAPLAFMLMMILYVLTGKRLKTKVEYLPVMTISSSGLEIGTASYSWKYIRDWSLQNVSSESPVRIMEIITTTGQKLKKTLVSLTNEAEVKRLLKQYELLYYIENPGAQYKGYPYCKSGVMKLTRQQTRYMTDPVIQGRILQAPREHTYRQDQLPPGQSGNRT